MAKFEIEVLAPRKLVIGRDSNGNPIYREFTAEDCRRYYQRGNRMLKSGIAIPTCWGHRDDARPVSADEAKSAFAKSTAGWVNRYRLDPKTHRVVAEVEVAEDEAPAVSKVRFASPEIQSFVDGDGRNWGEVVTHLALTPRPRQHHQKPITQLGFASNRIRLSIDPYEGSDMPQDDKNATAGKNYFSEALEALKNKGINLPDDTSEENIWERIVIACMQGEPLDDDDADNLEPEEPKVVETPPEAPIMLGFEKQQAQAAKFAKKNLSSEIKALSRKGAITPAIEKNLLGRLDKVQLSFDQEGELVRNDLIIEIDAYKRLPAPQNHVQAPRKTQLSHDQVDVDVAGDPPLLNRDQAEPTVEEVESFADRWDAMMGRK